MVVNLGSNTDLVKCPRCGKLGKLRLKDKRYNSVVVYHYDQQKYSLSGKGDKSHYIGRISKDPTRIISKIFAENIINYLQTEEDKNKFKLNFEIFKKRVLKQKEDKFSIDQDLTYFASILNELRKIRKIEEKKSKQKISTIRRQWTITCPQCGCKIGRRATFRGVETGKGVSLYHCKVPESSL